MQRPSDDYVYQRQLQHSLAPDALDGRLHGRHHIPCHPIPFLVRLSPTDLTGASAGVRSSQVLGTDTSGNRIYPGLLLVHGKSMEL